MADEAHTGIASISFSIPGKDITDEELAHIENIPQLKGQEKVLLEMDSRMTNTGKKYTWLKLEFRFNYISMADFMSNVRKILGKITFLDVKTKHVKHGNKTKTINISLDFEIPERCPWNEDEKSCMKPRRHLPFSVKRCVFGRRKMGRGSDFMKKYLSVTIEVSDSDNNLVLAVVHAVSTFSLCNFGSSDASCRVDLRCHS